MFNYFFQVTEEQVNGKTEVGKRKSSPSTEEIQGHNKCKGKSYKL